MQWGATINILRIHICSCWLTRISLNYVARITLFTNKVTTLGNASSISPNIGTFSHNAKKDNVNLSRALRLVHEPNHYCNLSTELEQEFRNAELIRYRDAQSQGMLTCLCAGYLGFSLSQKMVIVALCSFPSTTSPYPCPIVLDVCLLVADIPMDVS